MSAAQDSRDLALRSADAAARRATQCEFGRPLVLEAGAGTGKTAALVARIAVWAMEPGWQRAQERFEAGAPLPAEREDARARIAADLLSRVVAITFTDAAAAEMAARVGEAFSDLAEGQLPVGVEEDLLPAAEEERRLRAEALLEALDYLVVRTIHAWCRRLLSRFPLESGVHPNFEVDADGLAQAEVVREVVDEALRDAYARGALSPLLELASEGHGAAEVEQLLGELVSEGVSSEALERDPFAPERVQAYLDGLSEALAAFRLCEGGRLEPARKKAKNAALALDAAEACECVIARGLPRAAGAIAAYLEELAECWPEVPRKRFAAWAKGKLVKAEAECLAEVEDEIARRAAALLPWIEALADLDPIALKAARDALAPMLKRVGERLRTRGIMTYAGLLSGARALLRARRDVCFRVRREVDQLLVDEFQDTDALQCELVRMLALEGDPATRPGLFLVGDPKQSIYGWRNADLRAFEVFVDEVLKAGGEHHRLSVNFRSAPVILQEVERVLSDVMQPVAGLQPAFEPLVAAPALAGSTGFDSEGFAPVEHWVSWGWEESEERPLSAKGETKVSEAAILEAQALARDLRRLHDDHEVAWSEVGVLFRAMGDLEVYLAALREAGIPYAVERDRNYYQRREIIDASALLRCVLDPTDHLAFLTLLRSPAVGVPDAALIPLWTRDLPGCATELYGRDADRDAELRQWIVEVASQLPKEIPGLERIRGWEQNLLAALEALAVLRESFECDSADMFVEKLRALFLVEATEAARFLGLYRVANLERFFRELLSDLAAGGDCQALLRRLRSDVSRGREAEEERPKGGSEDAVRVMTIHKAKGLDFGHVYIVQAHKSSRPGHTSRSEIEHGPAVLEYRLFGASTLGLRALLARRDAVERAERVRSLYVALTRAKWRVVVMGMWSEDTQPLAPDLCTSYRDLLRSRSPLPDSLLTLMGRAAVDRQAPWCDAAEARWRFPALHAPPRADSSRSIRSAEGDAPPVAAQRACEDAAALRALRPDAQARMARPWRAAGAAEARLAHCEARAEALYGGGEKADAPWPLRPPSTPSLQLDSAAAAGTAIHRILEDFDFSSSLEDELVKQQARLPELLTESYPLASGDPAVGAIAEERARELLMRLAEGELLRSLSRLSEQIVARELPVLLPPVGDQEDALEAVRAVGFVAGTIDMLYRDAESGELVVVDYKTDRIEDEAQLALRAAAHSPQGRLYVRAVQEALELERAPRFELWFLWPGRVVSPL